MRSFRWVLAAVLVYTAGLMVLTGAPLSGVSDEEAKALIGGACVLMKGDPCGGRGNTDCPNLTLGFIPSSTGGGPFDDATGKTTSCGNDPLNCGAVTDYDDCATVKVTPP